MTPKTKNRNKRLDSKRMTPKKDVCSVASCGKASRTDGLCRTHYQRKLRNKPLDAPLRRIVERADATALLNVVKVRPETKELLKSLANETGLPPNIYLGIALDNLAKQRRLSVVFDYRK